MVALMFSVACKIRILLCSLRTVCRFLANRLTAISFRSQLSRNVSMNSESVSLLLLGVMIKNRAILLCTNYHDLSIRFCVGLPHIPWLFGLISFKDVFLVTQFFGVCVGGASDNPLN